MHGLTLSGLTSIRDKKIRTKLFRTLTRRIAAKRDFIEGHRLKAWVLNRMGRCKDASEEFKIVEKLSPNDRLVHAGRGMVPAHVP